MEIDSKYSKSYKLSAKKDKDKNKAKFYNFSPINSQS